MRVRSLLPLSFYALMTVLAQLVFIMHWNTGQIWKCGVDGFFALYFGGMTLRALGWATIHRPPCRGQEE